jgi:outer membrane usher protein
MLADSKHMRRRYRHCLVIGSSLAALSLAATNAGASAAFNRLESQAAMEAVTFTASGPGEAVDSNQPLQMAQNTVVIPLPTRSSATPINAPRDIEIVIPVSERGGYLGDLPVVIRNDEPVFDFARLAELLEPIAAPSTLERLRGRALQGKGDVKELAALGIAAVWDPGALTLDVTISVTDKERRTIEVVDRERREAKGFAAPAVFSVAANLRTSLDYVHQGFETGLQDPFVDASIFGRILGAAFESEISYDTSGFGLRRNGSRFVWDFEESGLRAYLGDIRPPVRSFQASQEALGLSIFSARQTIQPYRNFQPRGEQSFTLNEASNVDVVINGRPVRRLRLDSGQYNLTDFPFLEGQNRVQFLVEDRTGRRELGSFDVFFDRSLLEPGLSEWSINLGSTAQRISRDLKYDDGVFIGSGYWRQGVSNSLTAGANLAIVQNRTLAGGEVLWASRLGIVSADVGYSWGQGDDGAAATITFQRTPANEIGKDRIDWGLSGQGRTEFFNPASTFATRNTQLGEVSAFWSRTFGERYSLNLNATQAWGRGPTPDVFTARIGMGTALNQRFGLNADVSWSNGSQQDNFAFRIQLSSRFGRSATVTSSYETRENRASINSQRSGQSSLGNWSINGDLQRSDSTTAVNGGVFLAGGRGEIGLSHSTSLTEDLSDVTDQRTSLRLAAAIGFADGALAFGRPVFGAFAIVRPHRTLAGKTVLIDYNPRGTSGYATSRFFGPPLVGDISNYTRRELKIDVDDLPVGYDLGTGSIAVRAPYGAGYNLRVGSADNLTVIGRALNVDGEPIAFIAGRAKRTDKPDAPSLELFTNGSGTFSATGLGPGQWTITFNTQPDPTVLQITLPEAGESLRRLGDVKGEVR